MLPTILYYLSTLMSSLHTCPPLRYSLFVMIQLNLQQLVACVGERNREVEGILKENKP